MRYATALLLSLVVAGSTGCLDLLSSLGPIVIGTTDAGVPSTPDAGDDDSAVNACLQPRKSMGGTPFIVNGTREPTLVPLTSAEQLAVVLVWVGSTCSGTLIGDHAVLTARHCTEYQSASSIRVYFGRYETNPVADYGVVALHQHPTADLTVLELDGSPTDDLVVDPIYINTGALDGSWIGERVEASGFGQISPGGNTDGRYFVAEPIYDVGATQLSINGEGIHGVCFGDSGGPVMGIVEGGAVRVMGALSHGDSSCTGIDVYTRTDPFVAWIEDFAGLTPAPGPVPCNGVTTTGRCEGDGHRAVYCQNGELQRVDCAAAGQVCGYSTGATGYRCLAPGTDPCDGLDGLGVCDGNVSRWCDRGELRSFDCGACGQLCGWISDAVGNDCADDPCGGLDYLGRCAGSVAEWCVDGEIRSVDCSQSGQTCDFIDAEIGYYCQ